MSDVRLSIRPGETARLTLGYSEVCCHMRVAGTERDIKFLEDGRMVQILNEDGSNFSMPITYGEAGIYKDAAGYYHY